MFRSIARSAALIAAMVAIAPAEALTTTPPEDELDVFIMAPERLNGETQVANGQKVFAADWPTLAMAVIGPALGNEPPPTCTAAFVGPNVLLSAAHCLENGLGMPRALKVRFGPTTYDLRCDAPAAYKARDIQFSAPRGSEDFALCLLLDGGVTPVPLQTMRFEVVEIRNRLATQDAVMLTGYGCDIITIVNGSIRPNRADGALRIGNARIASSATGGGADSQFVSIRSNLSYEPALCPGDSGGPLLSGVTVEAASGPRRIRGVNSKIRPLLAGTPVIQSFMADTGAGVFSAFATSWMSDIEKWRGLPANSGKASEPVICGVNRTAGRWPCRA